MIPIASAVRRWSRGGAICELHFDARKCQFRVWYREVTNQYREELIPEQCTHAWLDTFIRDQTKLQKDSYYISSHPDAAWLVVLIKIKESNQ